MTVANKLWWEFWPEQLALALALASPRDASVLFGATTVEQLYENVAAIELLERLTPDELADLHAL